MDIEMVKLLDMIDKALAVTDKRQLLSSSEIMDVLLDIRQQTALIGASHE